MKAKPWRMSVGLIVGLIVGTLVWLSAFVPGAGPFQNPQLVIVPAALGMLTVSVRNRRKNVGPYDPETIERNKRGRF